jgi:hypothetical protein
VRHFWTVSRPLLRLSGLAAAVSVGVITMSAGAGATTTGGPVVSPATTPSQSSVPTKTTQYAFSCDLSGYGGSASTDGTATFTMPTKTTAGGSTTTTFKTPALPLSAAEAQKLASADTFTLTAPALAAKDSSSAAPKIAVYPGVGSLSTSGPTQILPMTSSATMAFQHVGQGAISVSAGFTIIPMKGDTAMPAIPCIMHAGPLTFPLSVTAPASTTPPTTQPTAPPTTLPPVASSGPMYRCVLGFTGVPGNKQTFTLTAPLPMTLTASGSQKTGHTVLVSLSSGPQGLGAPYPLPNTVALAFSGALAVKGAQFGAIPLHRATAQVGKSTFTVSGPLYLTKPGTDRIYLPNQFAFTVVGPYFPGTHTRVDFNLACTAASSVVGLRLNVTGQPVGGTAGGQGSGTAATGAVPVGAPNTGGGPRPGSDLPMVLGGIALLLLGGGGAVYAARRRRLGQSAA